MSQIIDKVYITREKLTWYQGHSKNIFYFDTGCVEKIVKNNYRYSDYNLGNVHTKYIQDTIRPSYNSKIWRVKWNLIKNEQPYIKNNMDNINPDVHKLEIGRPLFGIYAGKPFRFHLIIVGYKLFALPQHKIIDKLLKDVEPLTYIQIEYQGQEDNGDYKKNIYKAFKGEKAKEIPEDEEIKQISLFSFK